MGMAGLPDGVAAVPALLPPGGGGERGAGAPGGPSVHDAVRHAAACLHPAAGPG